MAASRITFAIGDLVAEIKALNPLSEVPAISLVLDERAYKKVVGEIEHHYGQVLTPAPDYDGVGVRFAGMNIIMLPPPDPVI